MHLWIAHIRSLESFADQHERLLDAWQAGGVTGLVIGHMQLNARETMAHSRQLVQLPHTGEPVASFVPDPAIYDRFGVPAPEPPPAATEPARARVSAALAAAADRGLEVWVFDPFIGAVAPDAGRTGARICDPAVRNSLAARMLDTVAAHPMATGVIIDGPAWGFEISEIPVRQMARRRLVFDELDDSLRPFVEDAGYDFDRLVRAKDQLWEGLHALTDDAVAAHAGTSADSRAAAWHWLGGDAMADWLAFRTASLLGMHRMMADTLRSSSHPAQLAVCPRQPVVAGLAGFDYAAVADLVDVVMPKLYYWQRGYDGTIGIAHRWAETLLHWNPGLSVRAAGELTRTLLGPAIPVVDDILDYDRILSPDHIGRLAAADARFAIEAIRGRARIVPWVDTGRAPHDGDPLTAAHLDAILRAAADEGIDQVNFFNSTNLTEADWTILSSHAGTRWNRLTSDFLPADRPTL